MASGDKDAFMTVQEWCELERVGEVEHEDDDGYVYAMAWKSWAHPLVAANSIGLLYSAFGDGPYIACPSKAATHILETRCTCTDVVVSYSEYYRATRNGSGVAEPSVVSRSSLRGHRTRS